GAAAQPRAPGRGDGARGFRQLSDGVVALHLQAGTHSRDVLRLPGALTGMPLDRGKLRSADLLEGVGIAQALDLAARLAEGLEVGGELLAGQRGLLLAAGAGGLAEGDVAVLARRHFNRMDAGEPQV